MPSVYRFFLSFFPSLLQVFSMQSFLYGKSIPCPTSLQRNSKVSERFLVVFMCKIAILSRNCSTNFQRLYLPWFSSDWHNLGLYEYILENIFPTMGRLRRSDGWIERCCHFGLTVSKKSGNKCTHMEASMLSLQYLFAMNELKNKQ